MRADIRQLRLMLLLTGVLLMVGGAVTGAVIQRSQATLDHTLRMESDEHSAAVREYFERARDVLLVSVQNPAYQRFYRTPGTLSQKVRTQPQLMAEVAAPLRYLHVLYPGRIGEACFIDGDGHENARVVRGQTAAPADLSADESNSPFFRSTIALRPGQVFLARPYVSPDTKQWVTASSTLVPGLPAGKAAMVHFEVTVESMRQASSPDDPRYFVQIIDRVTGQVVTDSRFPQRDDAPLGRPGDHAVATVATARDASGIMTLGENRVAYRRVTGPSDDETKLDGSVNANDWVLVVASRAPTGIWSGPFTGGPVGLVLVGLFMLMLGAIGYDRQHRQLYETARVDDLTGLPNRLALREALAGLIGDGSGQLGAVLLLDLDRFKVINDTLGHHCGDLLLVEVANRLRQVVPSQGMVARLGGDEFVVLLPNIAGDEVVTRVAGVLQKAVRQPMTLDGVEVTIATSVGIALVPQHGDSYGQLMRCADLAMYEAKRAGNDHRVYRPEHERHSQAKLGIEVALLNAIERDEFVVHYQPSIHLASGDARRVEALVRWDRPDIGLIPPATFLPVAEELGLMHTLTRHILGMALDQCAQWHADGFDIEVAVNLAADNCTDDALPADVAAMLDARELPPSALWLEITEHAALAPAAGKVLARLRRMGVRLALDDFGTGFSSLSYVGSLPIDEIKIDRSFIAAIERDPTDMVIVRAAIAMAHGLGQSVTAEGAETDDSVRVLVQLGVDAIQGYHYSRPLPAAELRQWLRTRNPRGGAIEADPAAGHEFAPTGGH